MQKRQVFLALGSNIEPRLGYLERAARALGKLGQGLRSSRFYETQAWGSSAGQAAYCNGVVALETDLGAEALLLACQAIECDLGRSEKGTGAPRTVDIDLLLLGEELWNLPHLVVPHPRLHVRRFVLEPLLDLLPVTHVLPHTGHNLAWHLAQCQDAPALRIWEALHLED